MEIGYYQIDSSTLSACSSGKEIVAFLPIKNPSTSITAALTFLSGFEISSIAANSTYLTPY